MGYRWNGTKYERDNKSLSEKPPIKQPDPPQREKERPPPEKPSEGAPSNAGGALTLGSIQKLNKSALESLAARRGVDISEATNNPTRARLIWADIEKNG